ncbi:NACHT domain-containing protein [Methylomonas sp. MK1]|uniref:NACHT domain-containing protein n=1 Tax=Methylomonas sp. MK1 TaxID=1131552 RepID=UPI00037062C3|nr:hypothetical protein [Methylomonas sp. MK1]
MLDRAIKKIYPPNQNNESNQALTFADILEIPNIILLGEPGAGKTYLFRNGADHEKGNFISSRNFTIHADENFSNKPIYIDALDEKRSRTDQPDSIDEIIKHIKQIKPSKVRLSCRVADWLGETDLELFKPYFDATGGYCVVILEALNEDGIDQILSEKNIANPTEFKAKAFEKGIETMLSNPQTLIMLADTVKNGQWPSTKTELFENATDLLLLEHNSNHKHKRLAAYKIDQLKDAAGAACAVLLITDIEGISLLTNADNSYADIPYPDSEIVLAAITKRAFVITNHQEEQVGYSHRTIAEYLAACWLVKSVRNGLPVRRVVSWLGIENHPAPELRGLYAWLTQLLPEHTDSLLENDPYGVLVLGDVSCLSLSSRKKLLNELLNLTEKNPWFRAEDWSGAPLGFLSTPDIACEFKSILLRKPQQFHLRSIVLDAIKFGEQQPELKDELLNLFCDNCAPYAERSRAIEGLIHAIPNGKQLAVKATRETLKSSNDDIRLKEEVIYKLYNEYFSPEDTIHLIIDHINHYDHNKVVTGNLWLLSRALPINDLPNTLDLLSQINFDNVSEYDEVWSFAYELLERTLHAEGNIDANQLWRWISRLKFYSGYGRHRRDVIKSWLEENPCFLILIFNLALNEHKDFSNIHGFWNNFRELVRYQYNADEIATHSFSKIANKEHCDEHDQFIFELTLVIITSQTTNIELFDILFNYRTNHPELEDIWSRTCQCEIPEWRWNKINKTVTLRENRLNNQQKNRIAFDKDLALIRAGSHLGWMSWLAKIYFSRFSDVDNTLIPHKRLEIELGESNLQFSLEGLQAALYRNDLPTTFEIVSLYSEGRFKDWWFAILAGTNEYWNTKNDLNDIPKPALKSSLTINLLFPSFYLTEGNSRTEITPDWQYALFQYDPELVQSAYLEVVELFLASKKEHVIGLRDICENSNLDKNRTETILRLLSQYPKASMESLRTLLLKAITIPEAKNQLLLLTYSSIKPHTKIRLKQKALWFCIGFLLDFENFKKAIEDFSSKRDDFILTYIWFSDRIRIADTTTHPTLLSNSQIEFIITLTGSRYPNIDEIIEDNNKSHEFFDAAQFVKNKITQLATRVDNESIEVLNKFINEPTLYSYLDHLKHAAANQSSLRRKQLFSQPNWQQTISALSNGKPTNIADLYNLTIEYLKDVAIKIRTENTDIFKIFWNEDSYGRITNQPKSEESCRDRLIDLLRQKFTPLEIAVEPEGHMVDDKRADIVLLNAALQKLPIEIKRNYHSALWTACANQLDTLYTRDPQASGYGIYLVFWFDEKPTKRMPTPPEPIQKPETAQELEDALRSLITIDDRHRLDVVVIDVTRPSST